MNRQELPLTRRNFMRLTGRGAAVALTVPPLVLRLTPSRAVAQSIPLTNVMVTYPIYVTAPGVNLNAPVLPQLFGPAPGFIPFGPQLLVYQAGWQTLGAQYGRDWKDLAREFGFANIAHAAQVLAQQSAAPPPPPPPAAPTPSYPPGPVPLATYPPPEIIEHPELWFFNNDAVFFMEQARMVGMQDAWTLAAFTALGAAAGSFMAGRDIAREFWPFFRQGFQAGSIIATVAVGVTSVSVAISILGAFVAAAILVKITIDIVNDAPAGLFGWPFPPGWTSLPDTQLEITRTELIETPDRLIRTLDACPVGDVACQVYMSVPDRVFDPDAGWQYNYWTGELYIPAPPVPPSGDQ
jgi:hypothetical protein